MCWSWIVFLSLHQSVNTNLRNHQIVTRQEGICFLLGENGIILHAPSECHDQLLIEEVCSGRDAMNGGAGGTAVFFCGAYINEPAKWEGAVRKRFTGSFGCGGSARGGSSQANDELVKVAGGGLEGLKVVTL